MPGKVRPQKLQGVDVRVTAASGAASMTCGGPRSTYHGQPFAIIVEEAAMEAG